jgi:hypothetical protein
MSITEILGELGGCAGGELIYALVDNTLTTLNSLESKRSLPAALRTALDPEFPAGMNLSKVRYVSDANGFGAINWWPEANAKAITIGNRIYFKRSVNWSVEANCRLLMHELVHVWQYQSRGSSKTVFACDYGSGYVNAGGYEANPMEKEARDFVAAHFGSFWTRYMGLPLPPPPPPYPHSIWQTLSSLLTSFVFGLFVGRKLSLQVCGISSHPYQTTDSQM